MKEQTRNLYRQRIEKIKDFFTTKPLPTHEELSANFPHISGCQNVDMVKRIEYENISTGGAWNILVLARVDYLQCGFCGIKKQFREK